MSTTKINYVIKWPVIVDGLKLFAKLIEINIRNERRFFKINFSDGYIDEYYLDFNATDEIWLGKDKTNPEYADAINSDLKAIRIALPENKCVCYPAVINNKEKNIWIIEEGQESGLKKYLIFYDGQYHLNIMETKNGWVGDSINDIDAVTNKIFSDLFTFLNIKKSEIFMIKSSMDF